MNWKLSKRADAAEKTGLPPEIREGVSAYIEKFYRGGEPESEALPTGPRPEELPPGRETDSGVCRSMPRQDVRSCRSVCSCAPAPRSAGSGAKPGLFSFAPSMEDPFGRKLFAIIDERGLSDPQVYKAANLDRKVFSKIRSNPQYHPSKGTAIALAMALHLSLGSARELLGSAGYALSHSIMSDVIVEYCITSGTYDLITVNELLNEYDQPTLDTIK